MLFVIILFTIYLTTIVNSDGGDECCKNLVVGGISYNFLGEENTKQFNCRDSCTYSKTKKPDEKFCFTSGGLVSECNKSPSEGTPISLSPSVTSGQVVSSVASSSSGVTGSEGSCQCGKKKTSRIVGGQETEVNEYPWMAALLQTDSFGTAQICGGSLVAANWVITASHCFFNPETGVQTLSESAASIRLGEHNFNDASESTITKTVGVEKIIFHPSYNFQTTDNDIALIKLSESVDLNTYTPVCLPASNANFIGKAGWVYGWGVTVPVEVGADPPAGSSSSILQEIQLTVVTDQVCIEALGNIITDNMFCAGGEAGKDSCAGDSGGPFTVDENNKHELAGVVSFGPGCAQAGFYGVYAETAKFRTWLDEQMNANGGAVKCD